MTVMSQSQPSPPRQPAGRWALFGIALALLGLRIAGFLLFALLITSTALLIIWVGLPLLLASLAVLRWFAGLHRTLAGKVLGNTIPAPYAPGIRGGVLARLRF